MILIDVRSFATLSCISSLATAPKLPLWRMSPNEYFRMRGRPFAASESSTLPQTRDDVLLEDDVYVNVHKKRIKHEQRKGRLFIAFALMFQVCILLRFAPCLSLMYLPGCFSVDVGHCALCLTAIQPARMQRLDAARHLPRWVYDRGDQQLRRPLRRLALLAMASVGVTVSRQYARACNRAGHHWA